MYTEFEKELIKKIINKQSINISQIIFDKFNFQYTKNTFGTFMGGQVELIFPGQDVFFITEKEQNEIFEYIAKVKSCIDKLHKKGYVSVQDIPAYPIHKPFLVSKNTLTSPSTAVDLTLKIRSLQRENILCSPELKVLVDHDFKTPSEISEERNNLIAERSLKVSKVAIIASVITTLTSTLFSYCTYSKDRNVKIEDPVTIKIENSEKVPIEILNSEIIPVEIDKSLEIEKIETGEIPIVIKVVHEYPQKENVNNK